LILLPIAAACDALDAEIRADSGSIASRRDTALASGAHIVSPEYPQPNPRGGKEPGRAACVVQFPAPGPTRPNPVTAPPGTPALVAE